MTNDFIVDSKPTKSTREVLPAGSYIATLYGIVDLGSQYSPMYDNRQHKLRFSFELPTEMREFSKDKGEQPLAMHKEYTLSFGEKANLRKDLLSWRGKAIEQEQFNLGSLIGKSCLLSIGIKEGKETEYNIINGISGLVKGMEAPTQINPTLVWKLADGIEGDVFQTFPDFLKKKILACKELLPKEEEEEEDVLPF